MTCYYHKILQIAFPAVLTLSADPIASLIDTAFVGRLEKGEEVASYLNSRDIFLVVGKTRNATWLVALAFAAGLGNTYNGHPHPCNRSKWICYNCSCNCYRNSC
ncbi:unnamed protein product [Camellia sinensis]